MQVALTATKYGLEYVTHKFIKVKGVLVLKMMRPNGEELREEDLR